MPQDVFEIKEEIAILRTAKETGWTREVSRVRWYEKEETIDIRWWAPQKMKAGKGVSLTKEEAILLFQGLGKYLGMDHSLDEHMKTTKC